jgi:hypothetical protein
LNKKFEFNREIKVLHKSQGGTTTEATFCPTTFHSAFKFAHKFDKFGKIEYEGFNVDGKDKLKLKMDKLLDKTVVTLKAGYGPSGAVEAAYEKDRFAGKVELAYTEAAATKASASAAIGLNKECSVGGSLDVDATGGNFQLKDYNVGAQVCHKGVVAALRTSSNRQDVTVSVFHKLAKNLRWGSEILVHPFGALSPVLTLGVDYKLSKTTSVQSRGCTKGGLGFVLQHRLQDPRVKLSLATEFDVTNPPFSPAKKLGLSLVFGNY